MRASVAERPERTKRSALSAVVRQSSYDGATRTVARNAEPMGSARFVTSGPWELDQIGGWFSGDFMMGDLAEVLVYPRALSESDTALTNAYLLGKYGAL